jgi:hypothetical protein
LFNGFFEKHEKIVIQEPNQNMMAFLSKLGLVVKSNGGYNSTNGRVRFIRAGM